MICFPNAKINIGLNIVEKRTDGYHNIETVFYPVPLSDVLEFIEDSTANTGICHLKITGMSINNSLENNLIIKAYDLLNQEFNLPGLQAHLHKIIPMGAGLGGGSSDAAFMLNILNEYFKLKLNPDVLEIIAAKIGSDCPFFLRNTPVFAYGKGNKFKQVILDLSGYYLVIVLPEIHVSTPDAFATVSPARPEQSLQDLIRLPLNSWKGKIVNDFENSVFEKYPEIKKIKEKLYQLGAEYASMSGSGSAVYGLFSWPPEKMGMIEKYYYWQGKLG
jgi:4-diphosphocytidyl-2-C-methyl-D-erythritol kinase